MNCVECGSTELRKSGLIFRKRNGLRMKVQQWQCKICGKVFIPHDEDGLENPTMVNIPIKIELRDRLDKESPDKSFSNFISELLDFKEKHTENPTVLDETLTELAIAKSNIEELKKKLMEKS